MFISSAEKENIWQSIHDLKNRVRDLEIECLTNKANKSRLPSIKTPEAPWGYKKNGSPRKRPGRPAQKMEVGL